MDNNKSSFFLSFSFYSEIADRNSMTFCFACKKQFIKQNECKESHTTQRKMATAVVTAPGSCGGWGSKLK